MYSLENDRIMISIQEKDLIVSLTDKKTSTTWTSSGLIRMIYGNYYGYNLAEHCNIDVKKIGNKLIVYFSKMEFWSRFKGHGYVKPNPGPDLKVAVSIILNSDHVIYRLEPIENMNEEELAFEFPYGMTHLPSAEAGEIVYPFGYGSLMSLPRNDVFSCDALYGTPGFSMPLYGLFKENAGLGVYIKTPFDYKINLFANAGASEKAGIQGTFMANREKANYPREIVLYPIKDSNYVQLAKLYRRILQEENRFVSLDEKIKQHPDVEKLVGSVILKNSTFSKSRPEGVEKSYSLYMLDPDQNEYEGLPENWTAREIFDTAHERGFDRVCVYNTGWNFQGFDSGYPTRFPPNPERGSVEEFKADADYARSLSSDYIYSVHDNYRDVYQNSEEFDHDELITDKNGVPIPGGIWRGGRAYHLCPSECMKYAKRDLPKLQKMLGKGSVYIDVMGCTRPMECYNDSHPLTREGDIIARKEFFAYTKEQMGSLATEGNPCDAMADIVDLGAFCYIHFNKVNPIPPNPCLIPIPLWQLVYHDSVLGYTSESTFGFYGDEYLLYVASYGLLPFSLEPISLTLSNSLRDAYKAEMVSHEFLVQPKVSRESNRTFKTTSVAKTVFSNGTVVIANFTDKSFNYQNREIKGRDFIIINKHTGCVL